MKGLKWTDEQVLAILRADDWRAVAAEIGMSASYASSLRSSWSVRAMKLRQSHGLPGSKAKSRMTTPGARPPATYSKTIRAAIRGEHVE